MTTIVTRTGKGSPLTHTEVDTNFTNLNTNKLEAGAIALGSAGTPSISFLSDTNTGIYSPGADELAISTNGVERVKFGTTATEVVFNDTGVNYDFRIEGDTVDSLFFVDASTDRVGIGSSSPSAKLDVVGSHATNLSSLFLRNTSATNTATTLSFYSYINYNGGITGAGSEISAETTFATDTGTSQMVFKTTSNITYLGPQEKMRLDASGRLLVGTSNARSSGAVTGRFQLEGVGGSYDSYTAQIYSNSTDTAACPRLYFGRSRGTANGAVTPVQQHDFLGVLAFHGANGTDLSNTGAEIAAIVDGEPFTSSDTTDLPTRLVFSTTADGASSPTERMRITSGGYMRASANAASRLNYGHEFTDDAASTITLTINQRSSTFAQSGGGMLFLNCVKAANSDYTFLGAYSGDVGDREFNLRGDGNAFADGTFTGGGADYAEYFEWSDSNPNEEDRRGISVVLDGDKIRKAVAGEDPIGVISGNPSVVGDAAWNKWSGKYLRDEFGTYIQEGYEVEDEDGNTVVQQRRKLNPAYDPDVEYVSREQRPEWDCVGLMGKLRIRKGQITGSRWIKMRDINDFVEEWLVR